MKHGIIVVGGSAGSFQTIVGLVAALPKGFDGIVILCLHRLKHVRSGFVEALSIKTNLPIVEPIDKSPIEKGHIYLAPANYHLLINTGNVFSLATSVAVNHSRPSIDLTFRSAALIWGSQITGVLLSGANRDGAIGLEAIYKAGGTTIVQDPADAQVSAMPLAALDLFKPSHTLTKDEIIAYLVS